MGTEHRLPTIRSGASIYPAVQAYRDLLADVRSILGSGTKIGYLKATLEAIANGHPQSRLDELLPWNFRPSS